MLKIRTFYDEPIVTEVTVDSPTRTDRSFKECNDIMSLVQKTLERTGGVLPPVPPEEYFDTTLTSDEMKDLLLKQKSIFDRLPSNVRERYGNDFTMLETILYEHPELFAQHTSSVAPAVETEDVLNPNSLPPEPKKIEKKEVENNN